MKLYLYERDTRPNKGGRASERPNPEARKLDVVRAEVHLLSPTDEQYNVFLLDAPDSFDVVVNYPNGEREIVWSLVKA